MEIVIVTGGNGFIGRHLVAYLKSRGYGVVVIDRDVQSDKWYQAPVFRWDLRHGIFDDCVNELRHAYPVAIVHLAARLFGEAPDLYEDNVIGTQTVRALVSKLPSVKRVIYTSSAGVYGHTPKDAREDITPTVPVNDYGLSKLVGEQVLRLDVRGDALDLCGMTILRLFNVYGEGGSGVVDILKKVMNSKDKEFRLESEGASERDFVPVEMVCELIGHELNRRIFDRSLMNVGLGQAVTIKDVVERAMEVDPDIECKKGDDVLVTRSCSDIGVLKSLYPEIIDKYRDKTESLDRLVRYWRR